MASALCPGDAKAGHMHILFLLYIIEGLDMEI